MERQAERERLVELIKEDVVGYFAERIADNLLANGVIVPPCKLKQSLWCIWNGEIEECKVSGLTQKADESFKVRITVLRYRSVFEFTPNKLGETVFLTREEAENALKGGAET